MLDGVVLGLSLFPSMVQRSFTASTSVIGVEAPGQGLVECRIRYLIKRDRSVSLGAQLASSTIGANLACMPSCDITCEGEVRTKATH